MTSCIVCKRRERRNRRRREGMTLIEIMIVVIIMALIATAVSVAVFPQLRKAKVRSTRADAQVIRSAVDLCRSDECPECPSVDDLVEGGYLDRQKRSVDAWDNPFTIQCDGDETIVTSAGPDEQMGTEDDIQ